MLDKTTAAFPLTIEGYINNGEQSALDDKVWTSSPLLNYAQIQQFKDLSLVRFRGMIQDMHDPEIYLEKYEVTGADGSKRVQNGKYRDCIALEDGENINFEAESNVQGERRTFFVVSIPGINTWTMDYERKCTEALMPILTIDKNECDGNVEHAKKRAAPMNDDDNMEIDSESMSLPVASNADGNSTEVSNGSEQHKRQRVETKKQTTTAESVLSADFLLNSPIPDRPSKACMVKLYTNFEDYPLNSLIDVVGFLSVNPALNGLNVDEEMIDTFRNEYQAHNPPPSLIPRLHAIAVRKLPHANPLLDARFLPHEELAASLEPLDMGNIRNELHKMLSLCLFGDELAADYLLSHLISTVYSRTELEAIGKFSLNIANVPDRVSSTYTKDLYEILQLLLPVSHFLPMTLENLNSSEFNPKKDYEANKLVSGLLQLAPHTHLVLDETQLNEGKLENNGVMGIRNIAQLIKNQQIKVYFQYYDIDYDMDIPVLVLSKGKSMLPSDMLVPLETNDESVLIIEEALKAARYYLNATRLDQIRRYLTMAKTAVFNMDPEVNEAIQNDFVEMRKQKTIKSTDEFHALLVLSRSLAISCGKEKLDKASWDLAKEMEVKRRIRVQQMPGHQ